MLILQAAISDFWGKVFLAWQNYPAITVGYEQRKCLLCDPYVTLMLLTLMLYMSSGATSTNFFDHSGIGDKKKGLWANSARMQSRDVAIIGVNALFSKKLSVISGIKNSFLAFTNRFASRKMVANISKALVENAVSS